MGACPGETLLDGACREDSILEGASRGVTILAAGACLGADRAGACLIPSRRSPLSDSACARGASKKRLTADMINNESKTVKYRFMLMQDMINLLIHHNGIT